MREIRGDKLLSSYFPSVPITKGFAFEGLANRDSISYAETYKLGPVDRLESVFRGTLRFVFLTDLGIDI
jgi:alpha-aminoadipic semialdehyde synthase